MDWENQSSEEKVLLNPSFCSIILWYAARGYSGFAGNALPFSLTFLVLPMVLHKHTREALPGKITSSLPVWLDEYPLARAHIAERARMLVPFTKDALVFGGVHKLLAFRGDTVVSDLRWEKSIARTLKGSSPEVLSCARQSEFVGRWLARAGDPGTVMALLGVRP
jgi:hypothetical protein